MYARVGITQNFRTFSSNCFRLAGPKHILVISEAQKGPSEEDFSTMKEQVATYVTENQIKVSLLGFDPSSDALTDPQQRNLELFEQVVAKDSVVTVEHKIKELSKPAVKPVKVVSKFRGELIFGSDEQGGCGAKVTLKVWAFALGLEKKFPSATKIIGRSKNAEEVGSKLIIDKEFMLKHPEIGTEEENDRYKKEELGRAYLYGNEKIPFNDIDEQNLKFEPGPKSMHVSCTTS